MTATAGGMTAASSIPDAAALAARYGLREAGGRPPMGEYLRSLWKRRDFARVLATSAVRAENQDTYLGQIWAVLNPAMNAAVYVLIFGVLLETTKDLHNFVAFIVVGTFVYRFFSDGVTAGAKSVSGNMNLVRSLHFPRAILPISNVLAELASLVPAVGVMVLAVLGSGFLPHQVPVPITWHWLLLPVAIALTYMFTTGVGFLMARLVASLPDFANLLPFVLRVLMYGSGVIWSINRITDKFPEMEPYLRYQPVGVYLELARQSILDEPTVPLVWSQWLLGAAWAVVTLLVGFWFFWRAEARYGRE